LKPLDGSGFSVLPDLQPICLLTFSFTCYLSSSFLIHLFLSDNSCIHIT
jgi:hypothetical protein